VKIELLAAAKDSARAALAQPLAHHGEIGNGRADGSRGDDGTSTRGSNSQAYLLRRLAQQLAANWSHLSPDAARSTAAALHAHIRSMAQEQQQ